MTRRVLVAAAALVLLALSIVLCFTGLHKCAEPRTFLMAIQQQSVLPGAWARVASHVVPVIEVALGIAGVVAVCAARGRSVIAILQSLVFAAFALYALVVHDHATHTAPPCGCALGALDQSNWLAIAAVDGITSALLATGALLLRPPRART